MAKTRRGFMKTGLGCIGLGGFVGTSIINAKTIQPIKVSPDYEAGMQAGLNASKCGPFLGWECLVKLDSPAYPGYTAPGKLVNIDFKNKIITVLSEIATF